MWNMQMTTTAGAKSTMPSGALRRASKTPPPRMQPAANSGSTIPLLVRAETNAAAACVGC